MEQQNLLNEHEAAKLLRVSVQLLRKWRAIGSGPKHIKLGKCVRYSIGDVEGFIASKRHRGDEPIPTPCEQVH
jgi:hypothetical protein